MRPAFNTLREANLKIRHQLETAEACIPEINDQIAQIAKLGLIADDIFWGDVVFEQSCTSPPGTDASHLLQVVLAIPGGLGIVRWERDEYRRAWHESATDIANARRGFVPFAELEPALKALLLPQAEPLLSRLAQRVQPPQPITRPMGWDVW
jgi:hypothetical protein